MLATQMVLISPHLLRNQVYEIYRCLNGILRDDYNHPHYYYPRRAPRYECMCTTFLPYIKLIYLPNTPCCEPQLLSETQDIALQTTIIVLHKMLNNHVNRKVLVREGLVDYLTCMPWYTTGDAQQKSRALVEMVQQSQDVDLQPPSLLNMAKACVAKNYCGLEAVVQLYVPDIIEQIYTYPQNT